MKTKKENSKFLPKNDDGTDLRRLPLLRWSRDDGFGQTLPPRPAETPPRRGVLVSLGLYCLIVPCQKHALAGFNS